MMLMLDVDGRCRVLVVVAGVVGMTVILMFVDNV